MKKKTVKNLKGMFSKTKEMAVRHRPILIFAIVVMLVSSMALSYFAYTRYQDKKTQQLLAEKGCSPKIIMDALPNLNNGYYHLLHDHVDKIKKQPEHMRDPNCLYIIAAYETYSGNSEGAKKTIDQLEKVYNERIGFSPYFSGAADVSKLKTNIVEVEAYRKQAEENSKAFNSSSQRRD